MNGNHFVRIKDLEEAADIEGIDLQVDILDYYIRRIGRIVINGDYIIRAMDTDLSDVLEVCKLELENEQYLREVSQKHCINAKDKLSDDMKDRLIEEICVKMRSDIVTIIESLN